MKKKNDENENKNQIERNPQENNNKNNDTSGKELITYIIMIIIKM